MTLTAAFESQESSCARLFEKGPLDHEIEESCLKRSNRSTCSVQNTFRKSAIEASSDSEGRPRLSFVIVCFRSLLPERSPCLFWQMF
jgi:hypothetical protein